MFRGFFVLLHDFSFLERENVYVVFVEVFVEILSLCDLVKTVAVEGPEFESLVVANLVSADLRRWI